jgi:hypothetical protein
VVAVDVAAHAAAPAEQRHVVLAGQQAHVVHLRHAGQEELDRARQQVGALVAAQRVEEGAVHLVQVQVRRGGVPVACRLWPRLLAWMRSTSWSSSCRRHQARVAGAVGGVGADVDDADAVVRVEHGQRIGRAHADPAPQRLGVPKNSACSTSGGSAKS